MNRMLLPVVLGVVLLGAMVQAAPTTAPVLKASELHGTWKLDKQATIDHAVETAPEDQKDLVRQQLNRALPAQTYTFVADGTYKVSTTVPGRKEVTDEGEFELVDGKVHLKSSGSAPERALDIAREGESLLLQGMLVLKRG